ncbi:MAG: diguanylate cyclase domain-containing protein [Bryobacteraceae bacterium]
MPWNARLYISAIVLLGSASLLQVTLHDPADQLIPFVILFAGSVLSSGLKVPLPGITGTLSPNFLFILLGVVHLGLAETAAIGAASFLVQYLWKSRHQPDWAKIAFNLGSVSLAATTTWRLFHWPVLSALVPFLPFQLAIVATWYFFVNTFSVAAVVALTEKKSLNHVWREYYFWSFPYYLAGAALIALLQHLNRAAGWSMILLPAPVVYLIYRSYRLYLERLESEKKHAEEMASLHLRTIEALALAIDAKDHSTHNHLRRVQIYAVEIGKELGLVDSELDALRASALLHDIGKLAVPEHIISKPGRLTPEEFDKMKIHPVVGAEILERVQFPYPVVPVVRAHHERWDGSGYPYGLRGEDIPLGARILAAVDCLDALASDRQYRRAVPLDEAMRIVTAESGRSFDPKVVQVLLRRYQELESKVRGTPVEQKPLEKFRQVERTVAPGAGYEESSKDATSLDFLSAIAAARQEVQILFEMTQDLGNSLSLNETLSVASLRLKKVIPYDAMAVFVLKDRTLRPEYVTGDDFRLFSSLEIPAGQGVSGWVAENRKAIRNGNPAAESAYLNDPVRTTGLRSALSVPLEALGGLVGVLTLYHAEPEAYHKDHLRILQVISPKLALSVENSLKYLDVSESATTDFLTNLPNARSLFLHLEQEVARAAVENSQLTVMACDLDGFKSVNDRFGHPAGDRALRLVARELRSLCRDSDYVARMGGDEFVIVTPTGNARVVDTMIERFREAAQRTGREIAGGQEVLSLSVGRASFPADGAGPEQLLAKADMEMYRMKRSRTGGQEFPDIAGMTKNLRIPVQ